jgi:hypothetical protein
MQSTTYGDLIEEKVIEWKNMLADLESRALKSGAEEVGKLAGLRASVDAAFDELKALDSQENVANTLATKDKIVAKFNDIDEAFKAFTESAPFML